MRVLVFCLAAAAAAVACGGAEPEPSAPAPAPATAEELAAAIEQCRDRVRGEMDGFTPNFPVLDETETNKVRQQDGGRFRYDSFVDIEPTEDDVPPELLHFPYRCVATVDRVVDFVWEY